MATGTGKTFTAFQIVYRFWKTRTFKKILYLADRNVLIDQTMRKDFKPFAEAMEKIDNKNINTSKEVFLGLYQQLKTADKDYYKQLPRDFFDLIIVDEEGTQPIGMWGRKHLRYIKENRPVLHTTLLLGGKLNSYLAEIDNRAAEMFERLMKQLTEQEGITEQLKAQDQMAWVGAMNSIRNQAEEIINAEIIYT